MLKLTWSTIAALLLAIWNFPLGKKTENALSERVYAKADSLPNAKSWPSELDVRHFAGPDVVPSPACLAVSATGEVFVGVDMIGSLGKDPGKGKIIKLVDTNNDGVVDKQTLFAMADDPRGIIAVGDQLFVLHTTFSKETGKASGMDLVVFEDKNHDGVADGPSKPLIEHISSAKFLQSRGTDHATNGIRMGIDGWIYIAVGDFGFHDAVDRSGKKLTQMGGGIVRVRPDGTEMEVYTHGLRNIYDVAIDPYMNIFTRDNTNDGGGWNIRFSHQIQSGEYGYPLLFQHFTDEIIPALADLGGGSGTGSLFMDDKSWPEKYNNVPMMADWGRNGLFVHRITPDGPTFTQKDEDFIQLSQITDVDVDASGRMFLAAWDGAGYSGNPSKGFVVRAVPKNWTYKAFPDLAKASVSDLAGILKSGSGVARLASQQELLKRPGKSAEEEGWKLASDKTQPLYVRVAGIYTYAQAAGAAGVSKLVSLAGEAEMREFALRAMTDRKEVAAKAPVQPFVAALNDPSERVRLAAIVGLGRMNHPEVAKALLNVRVPDSFVAPAKNVEGPHATPNAAIILPHLAVRSLVNLHAVDASVAAIGTANSKIALWALRYMYDAKAVNGLIAAYGKAKDTQLKKDILITLSRLYKQETPYQGQTWWSTRPDSHGPFYKGVEWASSPAIKTFLTAEWKKADDAGKTLFAELNERHRMGITEFGGDEAVVAKEEVKVDLEKIKNKKGQVGEASIEDVMLAMAKIKGNPALGKQLFTRQGCVACHSLQRGEAMKGPFMGQIGSIMNREQIAESILKPNASISQGFSTVMITAKGDKTFVGFVTQESAEKVVMRNITGEVFTVKTSDIVTRQELENSMMPEGLANSLSYEEFASLLTFLSQQKK